ncbi:hypothetical protein GCM10023172_30050 [Hymenobacter ginsengisoli]|uniref:Uncharacterized protein n=1 Tax=Hymenobacter ginsengisoli TaxID=1051626 RepID=A0ABP8QLJ6_9BACT|nr:MULTISPECIES: hypothetical protein [unclassified Hymenobacter]MBO2033381.1 hypothetical protein [Hymenobacter sp. BT559]
MKSFISVALLLGTCPVSAQVLRPIARPDSLTVPLATSPAAPDTVAALHRLFAARRLSMRIATPFLATVGAGLLGVGTQPQNPINNLTGLVAGSALGIAIAVSFTSVMKYSKKHEAEALKSFEDKKLAAALRRELRPAYFRPTKANP